MQPMKSPIFVYFYYGCKYLYLSKNYQEETAFLSVDAWVFATIVKKIHISLYLNRSKKKVCAFKKIYTVVFFLLLPTLHSVIQKIISPLKIKFVKDLLRLLGIKNHVTKVEIDFCDAVLMSKIFNKPLTKTIPMRNW